MNAPNSFERLLRLLSNKEAVIGVIGLGYVGLPLSMAVTRAGFKVIGFDIDPSKPPRLEAGDSYIDSVAGDEVSIYIRQGRFTATGDFVRLAECDVTVICVPTPLTHQREPDLSYVVSSAQEIAKMLQRGQLVVLESTTYPGTTREILLPILEKSGLVTGKDFFVGFSPEREDPGNQAYDTRSIPKIVSGLGEQASILVQKFYGAVVQETVPVSSPDVAEAVKITENVFRAVNIALVNELKVVFAAMGIDIWEVIEAAKTKPFGYMPFYPGPGLGGHCIPIDPFYLAWQARRFELPTRFVELAGEINLAMPKYVVDALARALEARQARTLNGARILLLGLAYKKNVSDTRESPSFKLITLLEARNSMVDFHDPHVCQIPPTRDHPDLVGRLSVSLDTKHLTSYDAVLIATDHDAVDYALVARHGKLIVDTRNIMARRGLVCDHVMNA